jgi:hypothetical protein
MKLTMASITSGVILRRSLRKDFAEGQKSIVTVPFLVFE